MMSTDRLYLVCRVCGETYAFFKYYMDGGFIPTVCTQGIDGGPLSWWIDEHLHTWEPDIPVSHIPEIMTEKLVGELGDAGELRRRHELWINGDSEGDDRSPVNRHVNN